MKQKVKKILLLLLFSLPLICLILNDYKILLIIHWQYSISMIISDSWKPRKPRYLNGPEPPTILGHIEGLHEEVNGIFNRIERNRMEKYMNDLLMEIAFVEHHIENIPVPLIPIERQQGDTLKTFLLKLFKRCCHQWNNNHEWTTCPILTDNEWFPCQSEYLSEVHHKIKNHCRAQQYAFNEREHLLTVEMFRQIHRLLAEGEQGINGGDFRTEPVSTGWDGSNHPNPDDVEISLTKLIDSVNNEINERRRTPYAIAAYFLYRFYVIHPFNDCNGRAARIIASAILHWCGLPFLVTLWFSKTPNENNIFSVVKKAKKSHNYCINKMSLNDYHGGILSYMYLKSHCQNLNRAITMFPLVTDTSQNL